MTQTFSGIVMRASRLALLVSALMSGVADMSLDSIATAAEPLKKRPVTAADVANSPAPGSVVPTFFHFGADGKSIHYLAAEPGTSRKVLWRAGTQGGAPVIIARPPGEGDTDANVSAAEALRRERMRLKDTGITQIVYAAKADFAVTPLSGDLFLIDGEKPLQRLTDTKAPELDPKISSDGSVVAYVRDSEVYSLRRADKTEVALSKGSKEGLTHGLAEFVAQEEMGRFSGLWLAPDGSRVVYQETDERKIPLYSITHEGTDSWSVETHRYPFAGKANAKVRLGVVPTSGGETTWLDIPDLAADGYLARVNFLDSETILVQVLSRDQKSLKLIRVDLDSGTVKAILEDASPDWVNLHDDLRVLGKSRELLWSSERSGYKHLEVRDFEGKLLRALTAGDWQVDAVLGIDEARREVWFTSGGEQVRESHVYRVSLDGGMPLRVTQEPGFHKGVVSDDGNLFVDTWSTPTQSPITVLRDREGTNIGTLADASDDPRLKELRLEPPAFVTFKNRDGLIQHGSYYAPRSQALGAKAPLIVMVYGGPHVQRVVESWDVTSDLTAQFLAEQGFAVWKTDNRGSSRRGHVFESPIHLKMGHVEVRDQVDGVRLVGEHFPAVDVTRVGVTGGSYGGYMTLRCLTEAPEVFKAGVSVAPVTDWDGYDTCYTERYMGTPRSNPEGYREGSVLTSAEELRGDLLIVHGMIDENVHFRHAARLVSALIKAGKPFEFLPLPLSRHGSRREEDRRYLTERMNEFFRRTLGSGSR